MTLNTQNSNINHFNEPEIIYTDNHKVACNGGGGALGHPITYYMIGEAGYVDCTYCDRRYIYKSDNGHH